MIPAAQTPYAKDPVFGYTSSNLKNYVEEKTEGAVKASDVLSLSIAELRNSSDQELVQKLQGFTQGTTCIVNAAHPYDLQRFVIALLDSGLSAICRTAASFVSAMAALPDKGLLKASDWKRKDSSGKLILLGSHVPKSTAQVLDLLSHKSLHSFELKLEELLFSDTADEQLEAIIKEMNALLQADESVLVYTQRKLIKASSDAENLNISERVSNLLCQISSGLEQSPHFVVAKGGITSSDIATKSLNIKKALVMGQVFAGVPVWRAGPESKFPGMPYVVFPGNVGEEDTLSKLIFST